MKVCIMPLRVLENVWISDRATEPPVIWPAANKPAVVQHTGASEFLPDAEGLFCFRNLQEAVEFLDAADSDYDWHSAQARRLAEE